MPSSLLDFYNTSGTNLQKSGYSPLDLQNAYAAFLGAQNAEASLGFKGWLAQQQVQARNEDRTLLNNLLGMGQGQGGIGTGWAFGGGGANDLFNQNMADIAQMGLGEQNRINQRFDDLNQSNAAALQARGLGGSNLVGASASQTERDRNTSLLDVQDRLAGLRVGARSEENQRRTGILQQLLGQIGGFDLNFNFGGA